MQVVRKNDNDTDGDHGEWLARSETEVRWHRPGSHGPEEPAAQHFASLVKSGLLAF